MTHASGPSKTKTINSALRHYKCRYVIQFEIIIILIMTFSVFALQINRRASVTPHITFLVVIQLQSILVSRIERHNRLGWTAFTDSLV